MDQQSWEDCGACTVTSSTPISLTQAADGPLPHARSIRKRARRIISTKFGKEELPLSQTNETRYKDTNSITVTLNTPRGLTKAKAPSF
jgi:hypothetical protein